MKKCKLCDRPLTSLDSIFTHLEIQHPYIWNELKERFDINHRWQYIKQYYGESDWK